MSRSRNPQKCHSFRPCLEPLEDRTVPVVVDGGLAAQVGSTLVVAVTSPGISTTLVVEDGQGDVAVAWNGGDFQLFGGISAIQVNAQGVGNIVAVLALMPLQTPEQLTLNLTGLFNGLFFHLPTGSATLTTQSNVPVPFFSF
jgi:hypothetical protein